MSEQSQDIERILEIIVTQLCGFNYAQLTTEEWELLKSFCANRIKELEDANRY